MNTKQQKKNYFGNSVLKNLLIIIITGAAMVVLSLLFLKVYTRHNQNIAVPKLDGLQVEEAKAILKSQGLHLQIVDSIYRKEAVPGAIIEQTPDAKSNVKKGRPIYVSVYSKNPQQISVPGLVDYSSRQAQALLISMGFNQLTIEEIPSEYSGLVLAVEYRGRTLRPDEKVPAGSPLKLVVGSGQETDSLMVNDEYVIPPDQVHRTDSGEIIIDPQPVRKKQDSSTENNNTAIDESFF